MAQARAVGAPVGVSRWTFLWMAVWAGASVATIYFSQPLLHALAQKFDVGPERISLVTTVTQAGYGVGIFLLVPLGDFLPKKPLVVGKLLLLTLATAACAIAPGYGVLLAASFVVGVFATTAQDLVPVAADLAPDNKRGQYIGIVMTGLMLGILLSRTMAGAVEEHWDWRRVFVVGALAVGFSLLTCLAAFPKVGPPTHQGSIASVYLSMLALLRQHAELRLALVRHGLLGLAFSAFWTNLSFFLSGAPYHWNTAQIGLMGLAGAAGAIATSVVGRLSDIRGPLFSIRLATILAFASFGVMGVWQSSTAVIIGGTVAFDFAVQSSLISHQTIIYGLDPAARGRINGLFVSALFVFFAVGSAISAQVWSRGGWTGVMTFCCVSAALAFALTFVLRRGRR